MKRNWLLLLTILVLGIFIGFGFHVAIGQQAAPAEQKGLKISKTGALDLGPQIEQMRGWRLGMRVIQLEPGGNSTMHSHKDRPGMGYVVQGVLTEQRAGKKTELQAGDIWVEDKDTTHWIENSGTEPVLIVAIDITKAP
jgi:quercetin dioxygenase-like cupin family protein